MQRLNVLRNQAKRNRGKVNLKQRLGWAHNTSTPKGFRAIAVKLSIHEQQSQNYAVREPRDSLLVRPPVNPVIDSHYFYTISKLMRQKISTQPQSAKYLIEDLANSRLLRRMNIVLAKSGIPPITKKEIERILLGPFQPNGMTTKASQLAMRLEEAGKRNLELEQTVANMLGNIVKMKGVLADSKFNTDNFIHAVEKGYKLEGQAVAEMVQELKRWQFEKEFFCDLYANKLKVNTE
jgi:hypothetical protein